jgi:hypothetical protein
MSVQVTVELPESVARHLQSNETDLSRAALEALALESYRSNRLTGRQVMEMLGFKSRFELDVFLKEHNVPLDYTVEDLHRDRETLKRILG